MFIQDCFLKTIHNSNRFDCLLSGSIVCGRGHVHFIDMKDSHHLYPDTNLFATLQFCFYQYIY